MANFNTPYEIEREGQTEFFDNYGIPYNDDASVLVDNTDGVYNGNIFEFKLNISNLNKTLFQAIKYLSKMRVKGESVPATILLIDLNATTVYVYKSKDYFNAIHKIYTGAASKDNDGFVAGNYDMKLNYSEMSQSAQVKKILKGHKVDPDEMYMPVNIDENCIVGWAERYYREKSNASKGDFLGDDTGTAVKVTGEIRDPRRFKGLINPYTGKSNEKFKYLMDCLNDRLSKKDLGAFYTPIPYAKKAAELVQMAVDRVPEGNDYIILDRCAGTGNLEAALIGLTDKNGDDLIEHCVVSTYEYYEYKVLSERIGDKVRDIIPPSEANVVYENGKVANADAMSEDFINNPIIRQHVDNPNCTIILFENPPYRDDTSGMTGVKASDAERNSFVLSEMKKYNVKKTNELANRFIWSAFQYYMRSQNDSYIVFSPVKYWKADKLINREIKKGFIFNRKHFHASPSAITCIWWSNEPSIQCRYNIDAFDIVDNNIVFEKNMELEQAQYSITDLFDKKKYSDSEWNYWSSTSGELTIRDIKAPIADDIIGFVVGLGYGLSNPNLNFNLTRLKPVVKNSVCALRKSNYKEYLPILALKHYLMFERAWYENEYTMCCADDRTFAFRNDKPFIKSCFIFAMLDYYNKCLSIKLPDGLVLQNELCFDDSRTDKPIALEDLEKYTTSKVTALDDEEEKLIEMWWQILAEARKTAGYKPEFNYGVYQITKELNTSHVVGTGKSKKTVYDYPVLNGHLDTLRVMLKGYYKSHITEKMFKYELLK